LLFPIGAIIPAETSLTYKTASDNAEWADFTLLPGENDQASKNATLLSYKLEGLPRMNAGEVKFISKYRISIDGILRISISIQNTGHVEKRTFD